MPVSAFDLLQKGILASSKPAPVPGPSGGISFVGSFALGQKNPASISLTMPAHESGDFALIAVNGDGPSADVSVTDATGWSELIDEQVTGGRARRCAFFWKILSSNSEPDPTVAFSASGEWSASVHVFRGVDAVTPFDATPAIQRAEQTNTFNLASPGITTATDNACVFTSHFCTHGDVDTFGPPAGYTLSAEVIGSHRNQGTSYLLDAGIAGAKSPGDWTNTGSGFTGEATTYTLALRAG